MPYYIDKVMRLAQAAEYPGFPNPQAFSRNAADDITSFRTKGKGHRRWYQSQLDIWRADQTTRRQLAEPKPHPLGWKMTRRRD